MRNTTAQMNRARNAAKAVRVGTISQSAAGRLRGSIETVLRKGSLGSEQLLAEVGAAMVAAGRVG